MTGGPASNNASTGSPSTDTLAVSVGPKTEASLHLLVSPCLQQQLLSPELLQSQAQLEWLSWICFVLPQGILLVL